MKILGKKRWFTLIEMLIVIVIIWVLASALIPRLGSARGKANDVARKADLQQIATAVISYQIDKNAFPWDAKNLTDSGFQQNLKDGGMASIPVGDTSIVWTGMDNLSTSGYMYYPMKKNGSADNGFLLVSKTETEWWSNYVYCGDVDQIVALDWSTDVDDITLCTVSVGEDCGPCPYSWDKAQLRYIYKY